MKKARGIGFANPSSQEKPIFAYVGSRTTQERNARGEGINVYGVDPVTGSWSHVQLVKDLVNPSFLAFDRQKRFLHAVHGDFSEVSSFAVDKQTGKLTFISRQSTGGSNPVHLTAEPANRFLIVANYATGSVVLLPMQADGSLGPVAEKVSLPGKSGPHKVEQKSSHPHDVPLDPTGRFIVVPDKGLDRVFVFRVDSQAGKLLAASPASVNTREGAGPRHVVFHPVKSLAYIVNELDSTVTTYRFDPAGGSLTPLQIISAIPETFTGDNRGSEIAITPSGRFVYASNRGHDSIAAFSTDENTGLLSAIGWEPSRGKGPRFFSLDPSGSFLYAANENSDTIVAFRINPESGKLIPTGQVINTGSPVCIIFLQARQ